jgi:hypothetical protein
MTTLGLGSAPARADGIEGAPLACSGIFSPARATGPQGLKPSPAPPEPFEPHLLAALYDLRDQLQGLEVTGHDPYSTAALEAQRDAREAVAGLIAPLTWIESMRQDLSYFNGQGQRERTFEIGVRRALLLEHLAYGADKFKESVDPFRVLFQKMELHAWRMKSSLDAISPLLARVLKEDPRDSEELGLQMDELAAATPYFGQNIGEYLLIRGTLDRIARERIVLDGFGRVVPAETLKPGVLEAYLENVDRVRRSLGLGPISRVIPGMGVPTEPIDIQTVHRLFLLLPAITSQAWTDLRSELRKTGQLLALHEHVAAVMTKVSTGLPFISSHIAWAAALVGLGARLTTADRLDYDVLGILEASDPQARLTLLQKYNSRGLPGENGFLIWFLSCIEVRQPTAFGGRSAWAEMRELAEQQAAAATQGGDPYSIYFLANILDAERTVAAKPGMRSVLHHIGDAPLDRLSAIARLSIGFAGLYGIEHFTGAGTYALAAGAAVLSNAKVFVHGMIWVAQGLLCERLAGIACATPLAAPSGPASLAAPATAK